VANGISINIGLNRIDPNGYVGYIVPELFGCENDANAMAALAEQQQFGSIQKLLSAEATAEAVSGAIGQAASDLDSGDILLLTYSGHGNQVPDTNGDEPDARDETWCLYDRQFIDDELYALWDRFKPGVRIFMLSDSCHSGSVARLLMQALPPEALAATMGLDASTRSVQERVRVLSNSEQGNEEHKDLLARLQAEAGPSENAQIGASVILISGCQDNQTSGDGDRNGVFTGNLLEVWDGGRFKGDYRRFWRDIVGVMPPLQTPNFQRVGAEDRAFLEQHPFTV